MRARADHVMFNCNTFAMLCEHCGDQYVVNSPVRTEIMSAISRTFVKLHRRCKPPRKGAIDALE